VLLRVCEEIYGEWLIAVVIFGSSGRGTAGSNSDFDILLIAALYPTDA
jgi:predicted nucleotidyltransferase